ncbi:MAG TPA: YciI family protein [Edaphobacter sp.]|nr:YciI family protein [Edaphobacter sp.]
MRCMVFVKGNKESEAGALPSTEILAAMGKFNEELVKAGVMLAGEGLKPSSAGKRVSFAAVGKPTITDGPFAETKELVAGFWIWQVRNIEEAVEWLKRSPFGPGAELDIRPIFEAADFAANLTPEIKEREERLRNQIAAKK